MADMPRKPKLKNQMENATCLAAEISLAESYWGPRICTAD
jgi:hypothetical protein